MATIRNRKALDQGDFSIGPVPGRIKVEPKPKPPQLSLLGALAPLVGTWKGSGFNQIWRPRQGMPTHFLQLNETIEELQFVEIAGEIPNRGLLQQDIKLHGMTYLQLVKDANIKEGGKPLGIHIEPGIWLNVPATSNPKNPPTVARLGNIPHGTAFVAQGVARTSKGAPKFPFASIRPFRRHEDTVQEFDFPEEQLSTPSLFRTAAADIPNVTQDMVDNPNSALQAAQAGKTILSTTMLRVSTTALKPPSAGGGSGNIDFLLTNANSVQVDATFWIQDIVVNGEKQVQLQYSQRVLLDFNTLSWPHWSVATLIKQP